MESIASFIHTLSYMLVPLVAAVVLHEYAHGWVAHFFGDQTAKSQGRLTINPLPHIDVWGSILVPLMLSLIPGGVIFGWAKPVPINPSQLHNPRRDMALVAIAGPLMNLCLAIVSGLFLMLFVYLDPTIQANWPPQPGAEPREDLLGMLLVPLTAMALSSIIINIVLLSFNLLPFPPLDGSRVLRSLLPTKPAMALNRLEPYGMLIIFGLLMLDSRIPIISSFIFFMFRLIGQPFLPA
ncbi:MAG: site-2 protease family protein [Nitrospirota bacterium]|nr:site-2 protease family protein [Nitrospirota bacterium]MDH5775521.1 site-2 protease family protein [Nitrospirota bacterium]